MKTFAKFICIALAILSCSCSTEFSKTAAGDIYASGRVGTDTYRRTVKNGSFRTDIWGENNSNAVKEVVGYGKFKIGSGVVKEGISEAADLTNDLVD